LVALGLALLYSTRDAVLPETWGFRGSGAILAVAFATVGGVISIRRPDNRIGWLFSLGGFLSAIQLFGVEYATLGLIAGGVGLPGAVSP
jgi:hypothetical protein